jgi:hypothetical protein
VLVRLVARRNNRVDDDDRRAAQVRRAPLSTIAAGRGERARIVRRLADAAVH